MIWVGTDDGLIQLTQRRRRQLDATSRRPRLPAWSTISMIEPSRYDADTAYVAVDRHKLDDIKPYVFMTADGGRTLDAASMRGLPDGAVRPRGARGCGQARAALRRHRDRRASSPSMTGAHWQSLQLNLPRSPVHDLVVNGDDLVVATHGRSFWILDDVTPLRQVAAAAAARAVSLCPGDRLPSLLSRPVDRRPPWARTRRPASSSTTTCRRSPTGAISLDILDARATSCAT